MPSPVTHLTVVQGPDANTSPAVGADGSVRTPTSFGDYGLPEDSVGYGFEPFALYNSPRSLELRFRSNYFHCRQHDGKQYDFDGNQIDPAQQRTTQPFLGSGGGPSQYIPLRMRRPSVPYRIGRQQVFAFTDLLFGQGRWPQMRSKDAATQAAAEELIKSGEIAKACIQARNLGGACGTAGLSWRFVDGKPVVKAHAGANVHVLSWADEDAFIPAHVVELKQKTRIAPDPDDGNKLKPTVFWERRDWTLLGNIVFEPVRVHSKDPPVWKIDDAASQVHGDGECHFVWIQNHAPEDDTEDGVCDYAETYEQQDSLDMLNSVNGKGVTLNLDPTLVLRLDEDEQVATLRKGSENALILRSSGGAEYLQLQDTQIGERTIALQRAQILEVTGCVLPDPDKVAAAASSGEALKIVYAPMVARCDLLRMQWGPAVERLVNQMLRAWRNLRATQVMVPANDVDPAVPVFDDQEAAVEQVEPAFLDLTGLPMRTVHETGPTGEKVVREEPHDPGQGDVEVEWGPYFKPTGDDRQKTIGAVSQATGGKSLLSQQTGVELVTNLFDRDAGEEWEKVQAETEQARAQMADDFGGDTGGKVEVSPAPVPEPEPVPEPLAAVDDLPEPQPQLLPRLGD